MLGARVDRDDVWSPQVDPIEDLARRFAAQLVRDVRIAPQLTKRLEVTARLGVAVAEAAEDGPFNVWIQAFVTSPAGLIVIAEGVDCVRTADPRSFELMSFALDVAGPFTLENAVAYTTTVPGVTEPAPDLC